MKPRYSLAPRFSSLIFAGVLASASQSQAVDYYWDGATGGGANWTTNTAWSTTAAGTTDPAGTPASSTTDDLFFNRTSSNASNTIIALAGGNRAARSITVSNTGTTGFRANGSGTTTTRTLTIGAGGITLNAGAGVVTIGDTPGTYGAINIALAANQTWTNDSSNTFTFANVVSGTGFNLTKAGTGTIRLNGANTYSGTTAVTGGVLQIGNYSGLTNTTSISVSGGGTLQLIQVGTGTTANSIDKSLSLSGTLSTGGGSGTNLLTQTWAGTVTLAGNSLINNNGNSTFLFTNTIDLGANELTFKTDRDGSSISGNITGVGGSFVKSGIRNLVLSGTNTFTGNFTLNDGTVNLGAAEDVGVSGPLGKQLANAAGTIILGGGTLQYSSVNQFDYSGRFSTAAGQSYNVDTNGQNVTWATALTSTGGSLTKSGAGTLLLTGPNTYDGTTTVNDGFLSTPTAASLSGYNSAAKVVFNGGTISVQVGGAGWTTAEVDTLLSNATKTSGALGIDTTNGSLAQWVGFTTTNFGSTLGLTKLGGNTLTLDQANNYAGATTIGEGTLAFTTANTLTGGLVFGASVGSTTPSGLDLSTASATFGSLTAQTNSTTANAIEIGAGQTLQINGAVTIGTPSGSTTTRLASAGLGTLSVGTSLTPTDADVQIGAGTGSNSGNNGTLDLSGLSTFYANLGTGTFRVGSTTNGGGGGGGTGGTGSRAILATNSTIQAAAITVGSQDTILQSLRLGNGTNTLNADAITVGTSGRASTSVVFNDANGSVTVRGSTGGTSRANLTMVTTSFGTGTSLTGSFDTTGHDADLMFETMSLAQRSGTSTSGTGNATATFSFDQGTLDANDLLAGSVTSGNATGSATGTLNLSGGTATFNSTNNPLRLGVNADESRTATGNLNISGTANVSVAANAGVSIRLGDASGAGNATGNISLTGGTLTVAGDIVRGAATGTSTATLAVNGAGAILNMGGKNITSLTGITYTDGTIKNLGTVNTGMTLAGTGSRVFDQGTGVNGEIQGAISGTGVGLTKQGDGKLTLAGTNGYDGATVVSAGTLFVTGALSSSAATVQADGAIGGSGTLGSGLTIAAGGNLDLTGAALGSNSTGILSLTGGSLTLGSLHFLDLVGWNAADADPGTYELIDGAFTIDFGSTAFTSVETAYDFGNGKGGYFTTGSLNAVIFAIPEPSTALLGALGALALLRRRRD